MSRFPLRLVTDHLILEADGRQLLVDTGSPLCVGAWAERWTFLGYEVQLHPDYMGASPSTLSQHVGTALDGLIGNDLLANHDLLIDIRACEMAFLDDPPAWADALEIPIDFPGIPLVEEALVADQPLPLILDTGAKISYLPRALAEPHPVREQITDFWPMYGEFGTPVHEVPLRMGPLEATIGWGILPAELEETLLIGGTRGVVGTELFAEHRACFAFPSKRLLLQPY